MIYIDPTGHSVWSATKSFFGGAVDSGVDTVNGLWMMVRHPIQTRRGIQYEFDQPIRELLEQGFLRKVGP